MGRTPNPKPSIYLREGSKFYRVRVQINGKRYERSTGESSVTKAKAKAKEIVDEILGRQETSDSTVMDLITPFLSEDSNPRMKEYLMSGKSYTLRTAKHMAVDSQALVDYLKKDAPTLLNLPAVNLTRKQCKDVGKGLVRMYGQTAKADNTYSAFKVILSQATDDGLLPFNPSYRLPEIKPLNQKERKALAVDDVRFLLAEESFFPDRVTYLLFVIFATTGMRRAEVMACRRKQLNDDCSIIRVDNAFKDDGWQIEGLPKWEKTRTIPLCRLAQEAFKEACRGLEPDDRVFPQLNSNQLSREFRAVREMALSSTHDWDDVEALAEMTPHALRHTLTTLLRLYGNISDLLINTYMSWRRQNESGIEDRYTHIYARNLKPVADAIDRIIISE